MKKIVNSTHMFSTIFKVLSVICISLVSSLSSLVTPETHGVLCLILHEGEAG